MDVRIRGVTVDFQRQARKCNNERSLLSLLITKSDTLTMLCDHQTFMRASPPPPDEQDWLTGVDETVTPDVMDFPSRPSSLRGVQRTRSSIFQ